MANVNIGRTTNVGKVRETNEDSIATIVFDVEKIDSTLTEKRQRVLLMVADGMGGLEQGEIASRLAISASASTLGETMGKSTLSEKDFVNALNEAFKNASDNILWFSEKSDGQSMGTTLTIGIMDGSILWVGHLGDSRLYLIQKGTMKQITRDHSQFQEMVDNGYSILEARKYKNRLTKALGIQTFSAPDIYNEKIEGGDLVLLCSDGLVNHLDDAEILEIILTNKDVQAACEKLVSLANERGGLDNISVVLSQFEQFG